MSSWHLACRGALVAAAGCAFVSFSSIRAEPVKLAAGTDIPLTLQHHVTSGYIAADQPVYFRVTHDVQVDGRTVIAGGTLVRGKMLSAANRGMVGQSGSMSFGVNLLPAVDGSMVGVDADLTSKGRSRAGATVAWTIFWGIPGLITKGVNPYIERGTEVSAMVLGDALIDPDKIAHASLSTSTAGSALANTGNDAVTASQAVAGDAVPSNVEVAAAATPAPLPLTIDKHKFAGSAMKPYVFDIERNYDLKLATFYTQVPVSGFDRSALLQTVELVTVDGEPVPEPIRVSDATADSFSFPGWSVIEFCRDGKTELGFRAHAPDGQAYAITYPVEVKIKKKPPKNK